jgi:hypothetical protein
MSMQFGVKRRDLFSLLFWQQQPQCSELWQLAFWLVQAFRHL